MLLLVIYIARMLPTRTHKGGMSPEECFLVGEHRTYPSFDDGGVKPTYVLVPKADSRKDWKDKASVGYFISYKTKAGYRVLLGDTVVTSVLKNVMCVIGLA